MRHWVLTILCAAILVSRAAAQIGGNPDVLPQVAKGLPTPRTPDGHVDFSGVYHAPGYGPGDPPLRESPHHRALHPAGAGKNEYRDHHRRSRCVYEALEGPRIVATRPGVGTGGVRLQRKQSRPAAPRREVDQANHSCHSAALSTSAAA